MQALLFVLCAMTIFVVPHNALSPIPGFRPPAVPLINIDPFISVWSKADNLHDVWPTYWSGTVKAFVGMIRVDGAPYRFMGPAQEDNGSLPRPMPQISAVVYPTRTVYTFRTDEVQLVVTFLTPYLPQDLNTLQPITYLTFQVSSADGKDHSVQLYYDNTAEIAVNKVNEEVVWKRSESNGLSIMRIGTSSQNIFGVSGDNVGINWGYFYVASNNSDPTMAQSMYGASEVRKNFVTYGILPEKDDTRMPRAASDDWPVLAVSWSFDISPNASISKTLLLAYDDIYSINFFGQQFRAYWRRNSPDDSMLATTGLLLNAMNSYETLVTRCSSHDAALLAESERVGGSEYATLVSLAYRQTIGGGKLVWNHIKKEPWYFMKEISSDGDLSTVDVIYPASPFFIHQNPFLLDLMLRPLMAYANNETSSNPWAPHHLGFYPIGNILPKQQENMPVEETGNMLLMLTAVNSRLGGNSFYPHYWPLIKQWGQYLTTALPDPGNQLCTDDFEGPSPHNANLAMKGIVALSAFVKLCEDYEPSLAAPYRVLVKKYVAQWMHLADNVDHYRLQYDKANTWSLKYNVAFQYLLGLEAFPDSVIQTEVSYYLRHQMHEYGVPLDNRAMFTKLDWLSWIAAMTNQQNFQTIFHSIYKFANESPSRVPLGDWYQTDSAGALPFTARTVVGGIYLRMCLQ